MSDRPVPAPPKHLSGESRRLWPAVATRYELEPHHLAILAAACEAQDRMRQASAAIAKDGAYVEGRFGPKAHPAISVERDSRLAMLRSLRELALDIDVPPEARPPSRYR